MNTYQPISCEYYDYIEHFAVKGEEIEIQFYSSENLIKVIKDRILDTRVQNGEEFIVLAKNEEIRLDHIISLDDKILAEYKTC